MFWLIEPNFADAAGNLHLAGKCGMLAYTLFLAVISLWVGLYERIGQALPYAHCETIPP